MIAETLSGDSAPGAAGALAARICAASRDAAAKEGIAFTMLL